MRKKKLAFAKGYGRGFRGASKLSFPQGFGFGRSFKKYTRIKRKR